MNEKIKETILYEDQQIIVCIKPAGLAVQSKNHRQKDLYSMLMNYLVLKGEHPYIGIVHRLDQPVEGVMVFAKTAKAAANLGKQMQNHEFEKYYLAVVEGRLPKEKGRLEDFLLMDGKNNISTVVKDKTIGSKRAVLTYEVQEVKGNHSLVRIRLETGRHHQIRVQMSHAGCPLYGDRKYGSVAETEMPLALCSCELGFLHPQTGRNMTFCIKPAGEAFSQFDIA